MLSPWQDDPFDLFGDWAQARAQETPVRPRDGRLFFSDGRREYVVMPFTLRVAAFSMAAQQAIVPLLEQARHSARKAVPDVEVLSAGVILYAAAAAEQSTARSRHHRLRLDARHCCVDLDYISLA